MKRLFLAATGVCAATTITGGGSLFRWAGLALFGLAPSRAYGLGCRCASLLAPRWLLTAGFTKPTPTAMLARLWLTTIKPTGLGYDLAAAHAGISYRALQYSRWASNAAASSLDTIT